MRALYEESVVPVREIARLAGVTERTLYKYIAKGGWRRRHVCLARDEAVAAANRGRSLAPSLGFAPAKGSGGRFIVREEAGAPHASGLKALDPCGAEQAVTRCVRAGVLSDAAAAETIAAHETRAARAKAEQAFETEMRCIGWLIEAIGELGKLDHEMGASTDRALRLLSQLASSISRFDLRHGVAAQRSAFAPTDC